MSDPRELTDEEKTGIAATFANIPATSDDAQLKLAAISTAYRAEIARHLGPHLKTWAEKQTPTSVSEARGTAQYIDSMLTNLGLCVLVDNQPALLTAERKPRAAIDRPSKTPAQFVILTRTDTPPSYSKKALIADSLPMFDIGPAPDQTMVYMEPLRRHAYSYLRSR